ncbi:hypothetical protein AX16_007382 [Volvariella volvacea WC 439]|nr:hypothetical protein AX16_007382 [Volvariella volvacea WC 439]
MPPQSFRERSDLTKQIKSILDDYQFGIPILRELLQNSDDAKATTQTFVLDCRVHGSKTLAHHSLAECQGPALLEINDSVFKDPEDWDALRRIHRSNKVFDESKTGKYGLGFRANYHITHTFSPVIACDRLYITDPHVRFPHALNGGGYFSLREGDGLIYPDHFEAFSGAGVHPTMPYIDKTIVRLPLRTPDQAKRSEICNISTSPQSIRDLFQDFIDNELEIVLLFLKHVRTIYFEEIGEDGIPKFLAKASVEEISDTRLLSKETDHTSETFLVNYATSKVISHCERAIWRMYRQAYTRSYASKVLSSKLPHSKEELEEEMKHEKLTADVGMAYKIFPPSTTTGRLFTLLPLPKSISLGTHIHVDCNFALTSDRQHLKNIDGSNSSNKQGRRESLLANWNKVTFEDFIPSTWPALLEILARDLDNIRRISELWRAWPDNAAVNGTGQCYWEGLLSSIVDCVSQKNMEVFPTFEGNGLVSINDAYLIGPRDANGTCPAQLLLKLGLPIIAAPSDSLYELLRHHSRNLNSSTVSKWLKSRTHVLEQCSSDQIDTILEYLLPSNSSRPDLGPVLGLPLIPLASGQRVSLSDKPFSPLHVGRDLTSGAIEAWTRLGIPFLHQRISRELLGQFSVSLYSDVDFFLDQVNVLYIPRLSPADWEEIRYSLSARKITDPLHPNSLGIYKQFHIFPIYENVTEISNQHYSASTKRRGPIQGDYLFVHSPTCPIPISRNPTTFIGAQIEKGLCQPLGTLSFEVLEELDLLKMSLDNWDFQPPHLQKLFIPRILARLADMPSHIKKLQGIPFIPVGGYNLPPRDVIDPNSHIFNLYDDEDHPTGEYSPGSPLLQLCSTHSLLCDELTAERLQDRIKWISVNAPGSHPKAKHLLKILDTSWVDGFDTVLDQCKSLVWVPNDTGELAQLDVCFFNDLAGYNFRHSKYVHSVTRCMSPSLASKLGIPCLSSILAEEDDEVEESMNVELMNRIQAVLNDYDIKYAINEFLANAHDAGAREFSMMLDNARYRSGPGERLISEALDNLLSRPALIIYNNAKFTEEDFKGILEIDKGGKRKDSDTIGRYGLGALSLFHFTDVATIISGEQVLFLDPTGEYLPPIQDRKRTAYKRSIKSLYKSSASYLSPFIGKYDCHISQDDYSYNGTMFRLPLLSSSKWPEDRDPMSAEICRSLLDGYYNLARDVLIFMIFMRIDACIKHTNRSDKLLWEVKATRKDMSSEVQMKEVSIFRNGPYPEETWLVATNESQIPESFINSLPYRLKVRGFIALQMAFSRRPLEANHYLFSALRLPCQVNIPCHFNALFFLPSSRRGIHTDLTSDRSQEGASIRKHWNEWIFSDAFPAFYIFCLSRLKEQGMNLLDYFPSSGECNKNTNLSQIMTKAFYVHLLQSETRLLKALDGEWLFFKEAISLSRLPDDVSRACVVSFLKVLHPKGVVVLPTTILTHLNLVSYAKASPPQFSEERPQVISSSVLRDIIVSYSSDIERPYNIRDGGLKIEEIGTILHLLLSCADGRLLSGLPLLLTGNGTRPTLKRFPKTTSPVLYTKDDNVRLILVDLLQSESVLHPRTPLPCVDVMSALDPPLVCECDAEQLAAMVKKKFKEESTADYSEDVVWWIQ